MHACQCKVILHYLLSAVHFISHSQTTHPVIMYRKGTQIVEEVNSLLLEGQ